MFAGLSLPRISHEELSTPLNSIQRTCIRPQSVHRESDRIDNAWFQTIEELLRSPSEDLEAAINGLESLADVRLDIHALRREISFQRDTFERLRVLQKPDLSHMSMDMILCLQMQTNNVVYQIVSEVFHAPDRQNQSGRNKIGRCVPYAVLLDEAIRELPVASALIGERAYRGVKFAYNNVEAHFPIGSEIVWYEAKSVAMGPNDGGRRVMSFDAFAGTRGDRTIFIIHGLMNPKSLKWLSHFPDEEEVLTQALQRFKVISVTKQSKRDGDPLDTADIIELQALPLERDRLLQQQSITPEDVIAYKHFLGGKQEFLKLVDTHCTFSRVLVRGVTVEEWDGARRSGDGEVANCSLIGASGVKLLGSSSNSGFGCFRKNHTRDLVLYQRTAHDTYNVLWVKATVVKELKASVVLGSMLGGGAMGSGGAAAMFGSAALGPAGIAAAGCAGAVAVLTLCLASAEYERQEYAMAHVLAGCMICESEKLKLIDAGGVSGEALNGEAPDARRVGMIRITAFDGAA